MSINFNRISKKNTLFNSNVFVTELLRSGRYLTANNIQTTILYAEANNLMPRQWSRHKLWRGVFVDHWQLTHIHAYTTQPKENPNAGDQCRY